MKFNSTWIMEASEHKNWNMEIWTLIIVCFFFFCFFFFVFFFFLNFLNTCLFLFLQSVVFILWLLVIASSPSSPCPTLVRLRDKDFQKNVFVHFIL